MDEATSLLTTAEAATALGVTPGRVRQLIVEGALPSVKRGRDRFIVRADVEAARRRQTSPGPRVTTGAELRRRKSPDDPSTLLPTSLDSD